MKKCNIHTWFFLGNGIGSFLCALHAVETARSSLPQERLGKSLIVVTRDTRVFREIALMYPHITILQINLKNLPKLVRLFLSTFADAHYVFHPISFGEHNLFFKVYSKFLTLWNRESQNVGAVKDTKVNRFFYSKLVPRDLSVSVFTLMERIVGSVTEIKEKNIDLLFQYDAQFGTQFDSRYVVIHPFAASVSRSLPIERWVQLIEFIASTFPQMRIIISGGPADTDGYRDMVSKTRVKMEFIQNMVQGSLQKMIQVISDADLFIGVDTGITHIACVLHKRCIVIGNRSNPCWLPTYNENAVILTNTKNCTCHGDKTGDCFVYLEGVRYYRCMFDIEQRTINEAITNMLQSLTA